MSKDVVVAVLAFSMAAGAQAEPPPPFPVDRVFMCSRARRTRSNWLPSCVAEEGRASPGFSYLIFPRLRRRTWLTCTALPGERNRTRKLSVRSWSSDVKTTRPE